MKTQVYDRFGGGLLVLIMLTIAVIAGQAEPNFHEPATAIDEFELEMLDKGLQIAIDAEQIGELESLSSAVETVVRLPITVEISIEESDALVIEIADSKKPDGAN